MVVERDRGFQGLALKKAKKRFLENSATPTWMRRVAVCGTVEQVNSAGAAMHANGITDLVRAHAFALGLAYGGVAFFLAVTIGTLGRRALDFAGLAFVAATWIAVRGSWGPDLAADSVALALALLALGGGCVFLAGRHVPRAANHPLVVTALAISPGAIVLACVTPLAGSFISRTALALATVGIGVGVRDYDAMKGERGASWLLFAVSAMGVYLAVPDTELARVMFGAALPFALLSVPKPLCRVGPAGSAALAGLFSWVVVVGGRGRPGSVVGGLATIGLLVTEPLGRRIFGSVTTRRRRSREPTWILTAAVLALVQGCIALYASRVVARSDAALQAFIVLVPALVLAVVGGPMLYPISAPARAGVPRRRRANGHHRASRF
jgi:hypothetical protein